ncbi:MAG: hypothetical protein QW303_01255 [Nitrososphaerota archaeon]
MNQEGLFSDINPRINRSKFFGDQHHRYGGQLQWPGINGYPVRGSAEKILKEGEQFNATFVKDFHSKVFDMSNLEDVEYYKWVMDRICNGLFLPVYIQRKWDNDKVSVYLEWCQCYYEWPE